MLVTSGQVSLAISSTIVFIFTSSLFLCGYVVQQKTVNEIREAIKPQPRPVHTNLYVPPKPDATPAVHPPGEGGAQVIEVSESGRTTEKTEEEDESKSEQVEQQVNDADEEEGLVQGADGGFLRKKTPRQRKNQEAFFGEILDAESRRASNSRKSADASERSEERLSRAARRKLIKDEFVKLAGEEMLTKPNIYKRRRLY